jgi:hypothetical protein
MIQKHIAMASSAPWERVAGLVDVIDETEELCYIDDDAPSEAKEQERSALETREGQKESAMGPSESSGLKPQDPIDLDPSETERPTGDESRSPPPVSDDIENRLRKLPEKTRPRLSRKPTFFSLRKQVCYPDLSSSIHISL